MRLPVVWCLSALAGGMWLCLAGGQETPPATSGATPLGIRQQRVERMMEDLERKFRGLKLALQENEPERAERLQQTLNKAKELLLQKRMGDVTRLLDDKEFQTANDGQKALITDIRALLALLLDEKSDRDKAREEYDRLDEWKKQIIKLIQAERGEKRESDRLAAKDKTLGDLAAKIKALEAAIADEQRIIAATKQARGEGIQGLNKIATDQQATRHKTEKVANAIATEAGDERGPFESKPSTAEADPAKAAVAPAADAAAAPPVAVSQAGRPAEPGEKPLAEAVKQQQQAEGNLESGKGKAAQQDEENALVNLQRALAELKQESQRIASLPPEAFDKLARKQDDIAGETGQLDQQMEQAAPTAQASDGGPPKAAGNSGGKPQPGQQKLQQAQKSMQQAAGDLRKQEPSDASRQQARAIQELNEALQEIEERLSQLREETQLEKLAKLEARFRDMLSTQQRLTAQTAALGTKRQSASALSRGERNAVRAIGEEERRMEAVKSEAEAKDAGLAGKAQQALDVILDDGTSVVFPDVVEQLRDDLIHVGGLLAEQQKTDAYTGALQREVETTLEELIEALQQLQQQRQQESAGGGGGGGSGQEPLLPNSAELKLLRSAQLRINRRTASLDQARPAAGALDGLKGETQKIAERQAEIAEMTIRILERSP